MGSGGKRSGAGRPQGTGKYKEETKPIRVPVSLIEKITSFAAKGGYDLPLYSSKVSAGFPSPADDHMEKKLDLNEHIIKCPEATFFVRATGHSMINAGIYPDDILVVDRSIDIKNGKIVIVALNGELTVKRLQKKMDQVILMPENDEYQPIIVNENDELHFWGVVTNVIHQV